MVDRRFRDVRVDKIYLANLPTTRIGSNRANGREANIPQSVIIGLGDMSMNHGFRLPHSVHNMPGEPEDNGGTE